MNSFVYINQRLKGKDYARLCQVSQHVRQEMNKCRVELWPASLNKIPLEKKLPIQPVIKRTMLISGSHDLFGTIDGENDRWLKFAEKFAADIEDLNVSVASPKQEKFPKNFLSLFSQLHTLKLSVTPTTGILRLDGLLPPTLRKFDMDIMHGTGQMLVIMDSFPAHLEDLPLWGCLLIRELKPGALDEEYVFPADLQRLHRIFGT